MTQNSNGNKNNRPSVEERAKAIGEEENGVFKLHTQNEIAGPKVLGTIDLSAINSNTRPKKKSKDERRRERNKQNGGGAQDKTKQLSHAQWQANLIKSVRFIVLNTCTCSKGAE